MAAIKPEVEITIEQTELATRFQRLPSHFVTMPDTSVTLPTLPDVGQLPEFKMAATTSGFDGRHLEFR